MLVPDDDDPRWDEYMKASDRDHNPYGEGDFSLYRG